VRLKFTSGLVALLIYGTKPLKRVEVSQDQFTVMRVISEKDEIISVAKQGYYNSAEIPTEQLEHLTWLHTNAKMPISLPKIKTKTQLGDTSAAMVQEYIISSTQRDTRSIYKNYKVEYGSNTYQMYPGTAVLDPKPSLISFMFPISNGAYSPAREMSSEVASIEGRLTKLQQDVRLTPRHDTYIEEFLKRLLREETHTAHPESVDYVFEAQPRPSQQSVLENAVQEGLGRPYVSTFVKKEAYGKLADPRIISTERPLDKLTWSQYQYTVAKFLKKQSWYMFGKTPVKIANKICKLAADALNINCTDFSRMDGRKTIITRTLNLRFMMAHFNVQYHKEIYEQMTRKINARASTASFDDMEYKFSTLLAQASGLPDTSNFNSLDNAFVNFVGFCNQYSEENGLTTPNQVVFDLAFDSLYKKCAIAGDDTVAADLDDKHIVRAAQWCGHVITSDVYNRGATGVNFLARIYGPDLWTGDPNSCTDVMRALGKFHTTTHMDNSITPMIKLGQKLTSMWYTDQHTPVIRELILAYTEAGGELAARKDHFLKSYWSQYDKTDQYPNELQRWMWDLLPEGNEDEFFDYLNEIRIKRRPITDILSLPLLYDNEIKPHSQQVVMDKDGEQTLVGEDTTRVEQPVTQTVTLPFIPELSATTLTSLLCKKLKPISLPTNVRQKRDRRKRVFRKIPHGMSAIDIIFRNQGMSIKDGIVSAPKQLKK
jgi:hypothetical protein